VALPRSDAVASTARRLLSGSPDGRPGWVRALDKPGDPGWFGAGSAVWAVHGSLATLVGGVRALLLQAAHPLALAGVLDHSDYREDPLGRLQRTNMFITTTTYGSTEQALGAVRLVRTVHGSVVGNAPDGRAYAANDPHLLAWVHVALTDSMLRAAQRYSTTPVDADAYVAGMAVVADALGAEDPPRTEAELAARLSAFGPELVGDERTREVVAFLRRPPLPVATLPVYTVLERAAEDLLDEPTAALLGLRRPPGVVRAAQRQTTAALLGALGVVLGPSSPAERASLVRAAQWRAARLDARAPS